MNENEIRAAERKRIGAHLQTIANDTLRDPESDAIDGYVAAQLLDLADTLIHFPLKSPGQWE